MWTVEARGGCVKRGHVVDFHALRVTYGTELDRQDVSLGVRQALLRHSDPRLTANTYTKPQDWISSTARVERLSAPDAVAGADGGTADADHRPASLGRTS
jgi:integrase